MKFNHILIFFSICLATSCVSKKGNITSFQSFETSVKSGKNILIENIHFNDEIDFIDYFKVHLVSNNIYQITVDSDITFKGCTFNKPIKASSVRNNRIIQTTFRGNISFLDCTFGDIVNFKRCNFGGRVDFSNSVFKKDVNFESVSFHQIANFRYVNFEKEARFQNSNFDNQTFFTESSFNDVVSFQSSIFNNKTEFSMCKFFKYTDFSVVEWRGRSFFNYAKFLDRADFSNGFYGRTIEFVKSEHKQTNFENSKFIEELILYDSKVVNQFNLSQCFFYFKKPNLSDVSVLE